MSNQALAILFILLVGVVSIYDPTITEVVPYGY
jgi:hypothetical protein